MSLINSLSFGPSPWEETLVIDIHIYLSIPTKQKR